MAVTEHPPPTPPVDEPELLELWEDAPGIPGFLSTVDHKRIGMRYIYTCFFFFFVAGLMALFMRGQLAKPNADLMSPQLYNELFTMHGVTMIFLFNTPVLAPRPATLSSPSPPPPRPPASETTSPPGRSPPATWRSRG